MAEKILYFTSYTFLIIYGFISLRAALKRSNRSYWMSIRDRGTKSSRQIFLENLIIGSVSMIVGLIGLGMFLSGTKQISF